MDPASPNVIPLGKGRTPNGGPPPPPPPTLASVHTFGSLVVLTFSSAQDSMVFAFDPRQIFFLQDANDTSSDGNKERRLTVMFLKSSDTGPVVTIVLPLEIQTFFEVISRLDIGFTLQHKESFS